MARPLTGANVLLLIRDRKANDIVSLCTEFELSPTVSYYVEAKVNQLTSAGLIVAVGNGRYEVVDNWRNIQSALDISLTQVSTLGPGSIVVQPFFGQPDKLSKLDDLFVAMPFLDDLKPVWEDHIKNVAKSLGLSVVRADDFFTAHSIISDVWNAICSTRAVIADCTGRNPNVFYEIGIAHTIGKPVVLIAQNSDDVPFDLRHLRYILYEYTPRGMQQLEQKLAQTLKTELSLSPAR
jgi:hypothetical protein